MDLTIEISLLVGCLLLFISTASIAIIKSDDRYITPNGATVIIEDDVLIVLSDSKKGIEKVYKSLVIKGCKI